jgi:hypothetical protein
VAAKHSGQLVKKALEAGGDAGSGPQSPKFKAVELLPTCCLGRCQASDVRAGAPAGSMAPAAEPRQWCRRGTGAHEVRGHSGFVVLGPGAEVAGLGFRLHLLWGADHKIMRVQTRQTGFSWRMSPKTEWHDFCALLRLRRSRQLGDRVPCRLLLATLLSSLLATAASRSDTHPAASIC